MYSLEPGQIRETWKPDSARTHTKRVISWRIVDPTGDTIAETTTKAGALALVALLNAR